MPPARRPLLIAGLVTTLALLLGALLAFTPGSLFDQPTTGFQPINISGDTCTSKQDCKQLLVNEYNVLTATEFEQKWGAVETDCTTICRYRVPPETVQTRDAAAP